MDLSDRDTDPSLLLLPSPLLLLLLAGGSGLLTLRFFSATLNFSLLVFRFAAAWGDVVFWLLVRGYMYVYREAGSSFFCSKKPPMFSWALARKSHSSCMKMRAFLPFRKPVRFICMSLGSGNWVFSRRLTQPQHHHQSQAAGSHESWSMIWWYQGLPCSRRPTQCTYYSIFILVISQTRPRTLQGLVLLG